MASNPSIAELLVADSPTRPAADDASSTPGAAGAGWGQEEPMRNALRLQVLVFATVPILGFRRPCATT
eukprot:2768135-Pyramimonas_sp.AAC.1